MNGNQESNQDLDKKKMRPQFKLSLPLKMSSRHNKNLGCYTERNRTTKSSHNTTVNKLFSKDSNSTKDNSI